MKKNKIIKLSLSAILSLQIGVFADTKESVNSLDQVNVVADDSYTVESMNTSTGLNLSLKDTPQIISVITAQQLEDRGLDSLEDLYNHITGVTINRYDERIDPIARGFSLDYYKIDGVPYVAYFSSRTLNLSLYDRVEIVKGANGLTSGAGSPGISINLIRKRANSKELKGSIGLEIDSEGSYILNTDISSALNEDGSIRGRLVVEHEDSNLYLDNYKTDKNVVMGVIDADFGDRTTISAGVSYEKVNKNGVRWGGLPAYYSDGSSTDYDVSTNLTDDWTYNDTETVSLFTKLEQYLSDDILLNASYNFENSERDSSWLYFSGKEDTGFTPTGYLENIENKRQQFDINVNIPYEFNNLTSEVLIGYTYNIDKKTKNRTTGFLYPTFTGSGLNYNVSKTDTSSLTDGKLSEIKQSSFYLANNLDVTENLKFILGARFTDYSTSSEDDTLEKQNISEVTPYIGLVYDLTKDTSVYASYTEIFNPQTFRDVNKNYLDPIYGNSIETGIKGEYFDKALTTSLGLFYTKQDNAPVIVSEPNYVAFTNGEYAHYGVDAKSKGIEFEVSGKVNNNTTLSFNLTKFDAKDKDGNQYNTLASRTTASLFAKYDYNEYTFGGGVDYNSKRYLGTITQKAYYLVNIMGSYKINKNLSTQINVSNLFDEKYYEAIMSDSTIAYGSPRTITAQLKYSF
jgi:outer membrane receptor for ferric coprogen and ferric-rhodotorulic acid